MSKPEKIVCFQYLKSTLRVQKSPENPILNQFVSELQSLRVPIDFYFFFHNFKS